MPGTVSDVHLPSFHPGRGRRSAIEAVLITIFAAGWQAQIWALQTPELSGSRLITVPCGLLMTLPLLLRRRSPRAVAVLVYGAGVAEVAALGAALPIGFVVSTVVAAGALGAYLEQTPGIVALAGALAAVWTISILDPTSDGTISVILTAPLFVGAPWMVGRLLRRMRNQHSSLESLTVRLEHEREENARASVLEERYRIGRELHDIVAHSLTLMVVQAGAAEEVLATEPERAREPLRSIRTTGQQALVEMRRLLGILRTDESSTPLAPPPGLAGLDALTEQTRVMGLPTEVRVEGEQYALPPGLDVAVYRLIQESLTNTRRHARATQAHVLLHFHPDSLDVEVTDDGSNRAPSGPNSSGHGLIGMRERVSLYGGDLSTGPRPEGGWMVKAHLPIGQ